MRSESEIRQALLIFSRLEEDALNAGCDKNYYLMQLIHHKIKCLEWVLQ